MKKNYLTTSDKAHIYYEDKGRGQPILFIPGHMCTTKFFYKNVSCLSNQYRVICIDSRGFGNSSKPLHGNHIERHADDIKELIDYLDLEQVTLVGWSLSGSVVVTYAHKYNGYRLKALSLLDCCLFPFSPDSWNTYNSRNYNMDDWNKKYIPWHADIDTYIENFVSRLSSDLTPAECQMVRDEIIKTPPWIGFALHSDWCHTNAVALLPELNIPVIIYSGVSKGHEYEMGRYYKQLIQTDCELYEFEQGGHVLFMAQAERFNETLMNFIEKHTDRKE